MHINVKMFDRKVDMLYLCKGGVNVFKKHLAGGSICLNKTFGRGINILLCLIIIKNIKTFGREVDML